MYSFRKGMVCTKKNFASQGAQADKHKRRVHGSYENGHGKDNASTVHHPRANAQSAQHTDFLFNIQILEGTAP